MANTSSPAPTGLIYDINSITKIFTWAQGKRAEIERAFNMKGGWEGWLQVELALCLEGNPSLLGFSSVETVEREQHVYNNDRDAVDLLVGTSHAVPNRPTTRTRHMIELKCESVNQDCRLNSSNQVVVRNAYRGLNSTGQLIPAFAKRMEVEAGRMNSVTAHYRPCQYTVIGISVTEAARDFVMQEKARDPSYFSYLTPQQVFGNRARPNDYFVMWFKSGYIPS